MPRKNSHLQSIFMASLMCILFAACTGVGNDPPILQVAKPAISPASGAFAGPLTVTIECATSGAAIHYTTDGKEPTSSSTTYSGGFQLSASATVKAIATKSGMTSSDKAEAAYTINLTVETPVISPLPEVGGYSNSPTITISCGTVGADIYYTIDGTDPTALSAKYASPGFVLSATATVRAIAIKAGMTSSSFAVARYVINVAQKAATPQFAPAGGTFTSTTTVTLSCATNGARIRYTIDASDPVSTSTEYTSPISVGKTMTVKAVATADGYLASDLATANFTINLPIDQVATPEFLLNPGEYGAAQDLTLRCTTPNSSIRYTTDGITTPTASSLLYQQGVPIHIATTTTIKAIGIVTGMTNSDVASGTFTINIPLTKVATPVPRLAGGPYIGAQSVIVDCATADAAIYYTLGNGSETPSAFSTPYTGSIAIEGSTTLKLIAVKSGMADSDVATAVYTIKVATPAPSLAAGTHTGSQSVTVNCATPSASIYYTLGGATPTAASTPYAGSISIDSSTTLKLIAIKSGMVDSDVATAVYTIKVVTPAPSPAAGTYTGSQSVTVNCATPSASIYYTLGGATPTAASTLYAGSISIDSSTTLKLIAVKSGMADSDVATAVYTIKVATPAPSLAAGTYTGSQSVTVNCATPSASIYYTLGGATPTTASTLYAGSISIDSSTTLKLIAVKSGMADSDVATAVYTIDIPPVGTTGRYFWGRWVRMDTNEEWRATDTTLSIGGAPQAISSINDSALVFAGGRIDKKTDNTAEASVGASTYTLFKRDGAFGTISGTIAAEGSTARSAGARSAETRSLRGSRALGSGLVGLASLKVVLQNINNAADKHEVTTDAAGAYTVPDVIPNETYLITPQPSLAVPVVPPPAKLVPNKTMEDAGVLVATPTPYNFKMSYSQSAEYLYESGSTYYDIVLSVANTGSQDSIATTYTLTPDTGINFETNPGTAVILGSIVSGASKTIAIRVRCTAVTGAFQDKKIFIALTDLNGKWEDSVSLRFYKREVAFNISSAINPVFGVVITPDRKTVQFTTVFYSGSYYTTQVRLPYQPGYLVAFSKATASNEAKYGFGIDAAAPDETTLAAFNTPSVFEPNDTEDQSYEMAVSDVVTSYLHMGDSDYFKLVDNKASMPHVASGYYPGGAYSTQLFVRLTSATTGATIKYTTNGDDPTASSATCTTSTNILIDKTSTLKAVAIMSGFANSAMMKEEYVFPMGVTITAYERLMLGFWTTVRFTSQTERWLGFEIATAGDFDLSLSYAGEGKAGETVDADITLLSEALVPVSGAVSIDSAYATPVTVTLQPGVYLCMVKAKGASAVSGTCSVGISAHTAAR